MAFNRSSTTATTHKEDALTDDNRLRDHLLDLVETKPDENIKKANKPDLRPIDSINRLLTILYSRAVVEETPRLKHFKEKNAKLISKTKKDLDRIILEYRNGDKAFVKSWKHLIATIANPKPPANLDIGQLINNLFESKIDLPIIINTELKYFIDAFEQWRINANQLRIYKAANNIEEQDLTKAALEELTANITHENNALVTRKSLTQIQLEQHKESLEVLLLKIEHLISYHSLTRKVCSLPFEVSVQYDQNIKYLSNLIKHGKQILMEYKNELLRRTQPSITNELVPPIIQAQLHSTNSMDDLFNRSHTLLPTDQINQKLINLREYIYATGWHVGPQLRSHYYINELGIKIKIPRHVDQQLKLIDLALNSPLEIEKNKLLVSIIEIGKQAASNNNSVYHRFFSKRFDSTKEYYERFLKEETLAPLLNCS